MEFIVHDDPVGRTDWNYIARADLTPFGLDGQMEQLWLRPLDDGTFAVACIPFRTYGLALGDRVRLSPDGTQLAEVLASSGHRVLRMLLMTGAGPKRLGQGIARIKTEITTSALLSEWSGDRHVAVDIPPGVETDSLLKAMEREVAKAGAFWEWAHAEPFSTHH